jgi:hypothetical protein
MGLPCSGNKGGHLLAFYEPSDGLEPSTPLYEEGRRVKLVGGCIVQLGRCWWRWWVVSGAHLSIASY